MKVANRISLLAIALITSGLLVTARVSAQQIYPRFNFKAGDTVVNFRPRATIYSQPSKASAYVGPLSLGEKVVVLENTKLTTDLDGRRYCWYVVAFGEDYGQKGYVAGSTLASAQARTPEGAQFLLSFRPADSITQPAQVDVQVKQHYGVSAISLSVPFFIHPDDTVKVRVYDNRGYEKCLNVIVFTFQNKACLENTRDFVLLWDGEKCLALPALSPKNGRPSLCYGFSYVFPKDLQGEPNLIKAKIRSGKATPEWIHLREQSGVFVPEKN